MNYIQPDWQANPKIKAFTTVRHTLEQNQALSHEEIVEELKKSLSLPTNPIFTKQTHSNIAIEANPENAKQIADAIYAKQSNRICLILTADCLPILVCNKAGTKVAAIHAGWRGLANGIIESTLSALDEPAANLMVWLGPAISQPHFEVGRDVYDAFVSAHSASIAAFSAKSEEKWLANLYSLARIRLNLCGVLEIFGGHFCTYSQDDLFFSYRRDKGQTGRMASLIWIEDNL